MLSAEEASSFVKDVLKIELLSGNPKENLQLLTKAFICTIPFQSANLISTPKEERHRSVK